MCIYYVCTYIHIVVYVTYCRDTYKSNVWIDPLSFPGTEPEPEPEPEQRKFEIWKGGLRKTQTDRQRDRHRENQRENNL